MTNNARDDLADLLRDLRSGGSFCTRHTAPIGDLSIEVRGVGLLRLPVTASQAKDLRLVARPAKYGKGEQTILDRRVRDTWEVPRSRVKVDKRRWNNTLRPMLDTIRQGLGLSATASLTAELHSMLVYEPHQFFAAHQDSEKDDEMIGSLVVMLPSNSKGGDLVVEHRGESLRFPGSTSSLTFVAFYADTRHEVLPVESGYRVVLTYNLVLAGDSNPTGESATALVAPAAELLEEHFAQPPEPRRGRGRQALGPPDRLVYLLDHQYTERSLRWSQLKGDDTYRADVLRRAADQAGCDVALAHAEIQETWDCYDSEPQRWRHRGRSSWDDAPDSTDYELGEILDSAVTIAPAAGEVSAFDPYVESIELAATTPSVELTPHNTEFTGYMGNWGNTMDRWYRRAAIVIWPRARSFAVRAKGDPLGALHELLGSTADHPDPGAQTRADNVETLLQFWSELVHSEDSSTLLSPALLLAQDLGDIALSVRLLNPFALEALKPADATVLLALTERHGLQWFEGQLTSWMARRPRLSSSTATVRETWVVKTLPDLCTSLGDDQHAPAYVKGEVTRALVTRVWNRLNNTIASTAAIATPSVRQATLTELATPLLEVMRCAAIADDSELSEEIVDAVRDPALRLTPLLLGLIEASASLPPDQLDELGVIPLAQHCARELQGELGRPQRATGDWSVTDFEPGNCCDDCIDLAQFLADTTHRQLVWPLAKPRRLHIHRRIDQAELPVTHQTKRKGSPHKLVLTKTATLFTREAKRRGEAQASLNHVKQLLGTVR